MVLRGIPVSAVECAEGKLLVVASCKEMVLDTRLLEALKVVLTEIWLLGSPAVSGISQYSLNTFLAFVPSAVSFAHAVRTSAPITLSKYVELV